MRFEVHNPFEDEPSVAGRIATPCCPERRDSISRHDDSRVRAFPVEGSVSSHRRAVRSEAGHISARKRAYEPRSRCLKSRHPAHSSNGLHRGRTRNGPNVLSKHGFSFVVRFAVCEPPHAESIRGGLPNPCATPTTTTDFRGPQQKTQRAQRQAAGHDRTPAVARVRSGAKEN